MNNRKYLVMGGSIIGIILILVVSMMILSSCTKKSDYSNIEKKLVTAAENYISDEKATISDGSQLILSDTDLANEGYIKPMTDLTNDTCSGYVTIMNNGGQMNYLPELNCSNYETNNLKNQIISDSLTSNGDGLYALDGEYVFRGKKPNNHLEFGGQDWYILKIDANGNLRLISTDPSNQVVQWDNKYNEDTKYTSGENVYIQSDIYDYLNNKFEGYKDKTKQHMIPYDVCTGTRVRTNIVKSSTIDCAQTVKQYVGLLTPTDYANASYDKDCTDLLKGSCINFNYLYENIEETWTAIAISDSTFETILYTAGTFIATPAREAHKYYLVISISGNELYTKGSGTEEDPYIIK